MTNLAQQMVAPPDCYRQRRAKLAAQIRRPIVLFAGEGRARNYATNTHPFRAGSTYLYYGGPPVSGAALLIQPESNGTDGCYLARPEMDFEAIVWIGGTPSTEQLAAVSGLNESAFISSPSLASQLRGRRAAYVAPPCLPTAAWATSLDIEPAKPEDLQPIIDMRLTKDEHELEAMRRAAKVSIEAHLAAMRAAQPGRREVDVVAALRSVLIKHQCLPSFTPIVTVHAEILHCESYPHALESGRLLVVDAGAEEPGGYACDITRTSPVSGKFTAIQRHLYDTILRAHREAVAACVPGRRYRDVHDLAARVICEGLVEAELIHGDPADLTARGVHTLFFPHGVGHLIGLDVHDMEDFADQAGYAPGRTRRTEFGNKWLRLDRDLQPGMTVTVEPGIYFTPAIWQNDSLVSTFADAINRPAVDALLRQQFGGIRIEDTICVRHSDRGCPENLTSDLPADADEVTAIVGQD